MSYESQAGGSVNYVQTDWENRDFIEKIQYNILKIVEFFNSFDRTARCKIATINERLTSLERVVDYLEISLRSLELTDKENSNFISWQKNLNEKIKKNYVNNTSNYTNANTNNANRMVQIQRVSPGDNTLYPTPKSNVTVHYTGYLQSDGSIFDSSDNAEPYRFSLGAGQVIQGLEEALVQMSVNERCRILIPSELGYGSLGIPGRIPPNSDLVYDVHLLEVH